MDEGRRSPAQHPCAAWSCSHRIDHLLSIGKAAENLGATNNDQERLLLTLMQNGEGKCFHLSSWIQMDNKNAVCMIDGLIMLDACLISMYFLWNVLNLLLYEWDGRHDSHDMQNRECRCYSCCDYDVSGFIIVAVIWLNKQPFS